MPNLSTLDFPVSAFVKYDSYKEARLSINGQISSWVMTNWYFGLLHLQFLEQLLTS